MEPDFMKKYISLSHQEITISIENKDHEFSHDIIGKPLKSFYRGEEDSKLEKPLIP
jgi:hypothetical protein